MTELKRFKYIDIAKGFAILLVIFGHTFRESMRADFYLCDFSYRFVYRFHVSLLFMLSGMGYALTKRKNIEQKPSLYIRKKAKTLLLPYISYSLLIYAAFAAFQCIPQIRAILTGSSYEFIAPLPYLGKLLQNENPYCFHIWYLQTLFLYTVCTYFADKFLGEKTAKALKISVILLAPLAYDMFFTGLCWTFKGFMQKIMFFLLGTFITDDFIQKHKKHLLPLGTFCGAGVAVMLVSKSISELYSVKHLGIAVSYFENALIVGFCLGIIALCAVFENKLAKMADFGRNTMPYYLYHQPFCCAFLGIVLYEKLHLPAAATVIVCMTASLAVPYVILKIVNKTKLGTVIRKTGLPT